ncbi:MAG: hypothetical protein OIN85_00910 [Candidatus Methanoperedens sp.]|nr:hypothetical protein [Candidatus Methanoperedens sp.]
MAEMVAEAAAKRLLENPEKPLPLSPRAKSMLRKIRHKFPDFDPALEAEIWLKAHRMGLTEDE